jgi:hypothetical protein
MEPIIDEMRRVKDIADIRPARYRFWVDTLSARITELERALAEAQAKAKAKVGA